MMKRLAFALFLSALSFGSAAAQAAQTQPTPPAAAAGAAAAEIKAAKGVDKREPVDEGTSFAAGDTVFAWTRVTGANGTKVTHVWKKDGKQAWKATLRIGSNRWTTNSRRKVTAGAYTVEVVAADGTVLGSVDFTVQ